MSHTRREAFDPRRWFKKSASPEPRPAPETHSAPADHSHTEHHSTESQPTRRDVLETGAKGALVVAGIALAEKLGVTSLLESPEANTADQHSPEPTPPEPVSETHSTEHAEHEEPSSANLWTAATVSSAFTGCVGRALAGKPFDEKTVAFMGGATLARWGTLLSTGEGRDQKVVKHELGETALNLGLANLLTWISDMTNEQLRVNADRIIGLVERVVQQENGETTDEAIDFPSLNAPMAEWRVYHEEKKKAVVQRAAQLMAMSSALSPLGTTYTSSAIANTIKENVLRVLYKESYAREVIAKKEETYAQEPQTEKGTPLTRAMESWKGGRVEPVLDATAIETAASKRTHDLFNGYWGFDRLVFLLSANGHGAPLFGDPPKIFFFMRHWKHPGRILKNELVGAALSESMTVAFSELWLARAGLLDQSGASMQEFFDTQAKTMKSMQASVRESELRNVSFGGGKKVAKTIIDALEQGQEFGAQTPEFVQALRSIPEAKLQLSFGEYFRKRTRFAERIKDHLPGRTPIDWKQADEATKELDEHQSTMTLDGFLQTLSHADGSTVNRYVGILERTAQQASVQRLASVLSGLKEASAQSFLEPASVDEDEEEIDVSPVPSEQAAERAESLSEPEVRSEEVEAARRKWRILQGELQTMVKDSEMLNRGERLERARALQQRLKEVQSADLPEEEKQRQVHAIWAEMQENFRRVGEDTVARAVNEVAIGSNVERPEDVIPGLKVEIEQGEAPEEAAKRVKPTHHAEGLLGELDHSAQEVWKALHTQIPAVPSLVTMASWSLPKIFHIEKGVKPTRQQTEGVIKTYMATILVITSFADNVAAYMFGEDSVAAYVKDTLFGQLNEQLQETLDNSDLLDWVDICSVQLAMWAGANTLVGNGPNFSQQILQLVHNHQTNRLEVNRSEMKMLNSMKNGYVHMANAGLWYASKEMIMHEIDGAENQFAQPQAQAA